jgi:hypothetical protein
MTVRSLLRWGRLTLGVVLASGGAASAAAPASPEPSTPSAGPTRSKTQWELSVSARDDGSRSVLASLPADAPIASGFSQVTPKLVLRYRAGQTVAYIVFDTFLGDEPVNASVTFGSAPAVHQKWPLSSDGRTAFVPGDALAFIRQLQKVDSLAIRIDRPKRAAIAVSFSPTQTDLVIKALLAAGVKYGN